MTEQHPKEVEHPLPELLDRVLNEGEGFARSDGWKVKTRGDTIEIGWYGEEPVTRGDVVVVARFPTYPSDGDDPALYGRIYRFCEECGEFTRHSESDPEQ